MKIARRDNDVGCGSVCVSCWAPRNWALVFLCVFAAMSFIQHRSPVLYQRAGENHNDDLAATIPKTSIPSNPQTKSNPPEDPLVSTDAAKLIQRKRKNYPPGAQMGHAQMDGILANLPWNGNLLVWGLGNDSPYWHNATQGTVIFLEDDFVETKNNVQWFDTITHKYPFLQSYKVHYSTHNNDADYRKYMADPWSTDLEIPHFPQIVRDTHWDVILVDAPLGCCDMGPARFQSLYMSTQLAKQQLLRYQQQQQQQQSRTEPHVHIIVDDYERTIERDFSRRVLGSLEPTRVLTRQAGVSNANQQAHFVLHATDCVVQGTCDAKSRR